MSGDVSPADHSVLVIGGGFLGTAIAAQLVVSSSTTILARRALLPDSLPGVRFVAGDATDAALLGPALTGVTDVVFCAGSALPAETERDPVAAAQLDLAPLATTLKLLRERPDVGLLYLSSGGTIYGEPDVLPVPESHPLRPLTRYGAMKAEAEAMLGQLREERNGGATALRCANVYGPGQRPWRSQGVVATLVAAARSGVPVPIYGDDQAVRDHLWIDDVGSVVAALIGRRDLPPALNVGSGVGTTLQHLLSLVEAATGRPIHAERMPARATDLHSILLDISSLRSLTGHVPTPLEAGLRRLLDQPQRLVT
jgi:UDP-glucose 4-epimerase